MSVKIVKGMIVQHKSQRNVICLYPEEKYTEKYAPTSKAFAVEDGKVYLNKSKTSFWFLENVKPSTKKHHIVYNYIVYIVHVLKGAK